MGKSLVNIIEWQFLVLLLGDIGNVRDHESSIIVVTQPSILGNQRFHDPFELVPP